MAVSVVFFQAEGGIRDLTVTGVQTCALPIWRRYFSNSLAISSPDSGSRPASASRCSSEWTYSARSEEHTSELQSQSNLVCRLLLEKTYEKARSGSPRRLATVPRLRRTSAVRQ